MNETDDPLQRNGTPPQEIASLVKWDGVVAGLRMMPTMIVGQATAGLLLFLLVRPHVPPHKLYVWAGAHALMLLLTILSHAQYLRHAASLRPTAMPAATSRLLALAVSRGISWTLATLLFFPHLDFGTRSIFLALVCTLAVGAMSTSVTYWPVFIVFIVGTVLPVGLLFLFAGDGQSLIVGLGLIIGFLIIFRGGQSLHLRLNEAAQRKVELELLTADLRREREDAERARVIAEQAQTESEALRVEAERASSDKTRFLAAASHDLRQPMHSLGLFLETARQKNSDPHVENLLGKVDQSVRSLDTLFESLLDITRLDSDTVQPKKARFPLAGMFYDLQARFSGIATERNLQFRVRPTDAWVLSDVAMLERIVSNLVANALRYTERGGVLLAARLTPSHVRIEVWDTGIGMPQEKFGEIFDEFVQLANPERDRRKGLGLGLAIVKRLSKLLAAPINVRSVVGKGSMFSVSVPRVRSFMTALPIAQPLPTRGPSAAPTTALRCAVLLVDDDISALEAMMTALEVMGCEVYPAASIDDALATTRALQRNGTALSIVITDFRMGGAEHNGLQLLSDVRGVVSRDLPGIVVTGDAGLVGSFNQSQNLPLHVTILSKPASSHQLQQAMLKLLNVA